VVDELRVLLRSWSSWCIWESGEVPSVEVLLVVVVVVVLLISHGVECMRPTSPLIEQEEPSEASFMLIF
jgi:hypothetical protein